MADTVTVAAVQMQWRQYETEGALREDVERFLRLAREKGAEATLFPEQVGLMLAAPLAQEKRTDLSRRGGVLSRLWSAFSAGPDLAQALPTLVREHSDELRDRYEQFWGDLARSYRMVIVGGTLLRRDDAGALRYEAGVFDADGSCLGWQAKLHLSPDEGAATEAGRDLATFDGPFGRFGVLVGHDVLFPELARALAYRGCVGILCPAMAPDRTTWHRLRLLANARAQENQLFVAQSFLVGDNVLFATSPDPLVGRSAVLAPFELSPRRDGVLGEIGAEGVEGVVTGQWAVGALQELWHEADLPLRAMSRGDLYLDLLAFDYRSGATITERTDDLAAEIAPPLAIPALLQPAVELPDEPRLPPPDEEAGADEAEERDEPEATPPADEAEAAPADAPVMPSVPSPDAATGQALDEPEGAEAEPEDGAAEEAGEPAPPGGAG